MTPALGVSGVGGAMALYGAADAIVCFTCLAIYIYIFLTTSNFDKILLSLVSFILYVSFCWSALTDEIFSSSVIALLF